MFKYPFIVFTSLLKSKHTEIELFFVRSLAMSKAHCFVNDYDLSQFIACNRKKYIGGKRFWILTQLVTTQIGYFDRIFVPHYCFQQC